MDYTAAADKFDQESGILLDILETLEFNHSPQGVDIALSQAKRVRNASTVLVRELARERDKLQPTGGTS